MNQESSDWISHGLVFTGTLQVLLKCATEKEPWSVSITLVLKAEWYTVIMICLHKPMLHSFMSELVSVLVPEGTLRTLPVCSFFLNFLVEEKE